MSWQIEIPGKVAIIGGQAAGCKTAARLARLLPECEITVIEKGNIISFGSCGLPFYAAGEVDDVLDLAKTPWGVVRDADFFKNAKGVNVLTNTEVVNINHSKKILTCKHDKNNFELNYDALVLATGTKPIQPKFICPNSPRINHLLKPDDAKRFRQMAQTGKIGSVVILGGGYIGVELAEAMVSLWGLETTLIEKQDRLLPKMLDKSIARQLHSVLQKNDVKIELKASVMKVETDVDDKPTVFLSDGQTIKSDYLFLSLGLEPESSLADSIGIKHGSNNGILVNEKMQTSVPGIWAAGDCVEVKNIISDEYEWFPLGSLANRQGRVVADNIAQREVKFPGAVGTASVKVFDYIVANTGITAERAEDIGIEYNTVWGSFLDRPDYHPEKKNLFATMIYDPATLKIFGFQAAGAGEVTRYVDVVSALIAKQLTAYDLIELEHAYTPPHSSPLSPLNHLGAMIIAQEEYKINSITPELPGKTDGVLLDVRTSDEVETSPLNAKSAQIPQDQLRKRFQELDLSKPIHVICRRGPRSYESVRFLKNQGADKVDYVGGGTAMLLSEEDDE